jgi:hypothetical protein
LIDALRTAMRGWLSPEAREVLDGLDTTGVRDEQAAAIVLTIVDHATRAWVPEVMNTIAYDGRRSAAFQTFAERRLSSLAEVHDLRSFAVASRALSAAFELADREARDLDSLAQIAGLAEPYGDVYAFTDTAHELARSAQALLDALPSSRRRMRTALPWQDAAVAIDAGSLSPFAERLAALHPGRPDRSAYEITSGNADAAIPTVTSDVAFVQQASRLLAQLALMTNGARRPELVTRDGQIVALALLDELVTLARPAPVVHDGE